MTKERKQHLTELQGLVKTASTALAGVIQCVYENGLESALAENWQAGIGNLRECETTLDNLHSLLGFKIEGKEGEALDNAMFDL